MTSPNLPADGEVNWGSKYRTDVAGLFTAIMPNATNSIERTFTSREAFVAAIAATPALATLIVTEGRDVRFPRYWTTGLPVDLRYQVVSTDPTTDPTKILLSAGKWLTQVFRGNASVLAFGARYNAGVNDDLPAIQAACDWAMATASLQSARSVEFPAGLTAYLSAPITLGVAGNAYARVSFISTAGVGRGQSSLMSTTDNSPIWQLNALLMWGFTWSGLSYTWSTPSVSTKTARVAFQLGPVASAYFGDFYNSVIENFVCTNGHRLAAGSGMSFWGNKIAHGNLVGMSGGIYDLMAASGQPNNILDDVYIDAPNCIGPIFKGNAIDMLYSNVEINGNSQNAQILVDVSGGSHIFSRSLFEGFNFTANTTLYDATNSRLTIGMGYMSNGSIAAGITVTLFRGTNNANGWIDVDNYAVSPTIGSGSKVVVYVGGGAVNPSSQQGSVRFGNIRTTTLTWNTSLLLTDMDASSASDLVWVDQWDRPAKTEYWPDANGTLTQFTPRVNIFHTPLTADRTISLPYQFAGDYSLWSGRRWEFYKNVTGTGALILSANSVVIAQIPGPATGHIILHWNRAIPNGPTGRTWAVAELVITAGGYGTVGDANATLSVGASAQTTTWATALTANRTITLSTALARAGDTLRVVRTASGAFNLDVGGLATLTVANQTADVTYTGTAWVLTGRTSW